MKPNIATLHDASLIGLHVDWLAGACRVFIRPEPGWRAELQFKGVSRVGLPRLQPWGKSSSINAFREAGIGKYLIEIQSGDTIEIVAEGVVFVTDMQAQSSLQ